MNARSRLIGALHAARAAGVPVTRAARFGGYGADLSLSDLMRWPGWPARDAAGQERLWRIVALVAARDALPELIDGATLRAYAAAVGEDAFEAVLDLPGGGKHALPPATLLSEAGRRLAERALPRPLAQATGIDPVADAAAAENVDMAERIAA